MSLLAEKTSVCVKMGCAFREADLRGATLNLYLGWELHLQRVIFGREKPCGYTF